MSQNSQVNEERQEENLNFAQKIAPITETPNQEPKKPNEINESKQIESGNPTNEQTQGNNNLTPQQGTGFSKSDTESKQGNSTDEQTQKPKE